MRKSVEFAPRILKTIGVEKKIFPASLKSQTLKFTKEFNFESIRKSLDRNKHMTMEFGVALGQNLKKKMTK